MHFTSFLLARRPTPRQGVVLLVVMVMLALFAAVALSFVFYAESQANQMNLAMQVENNTNADADPEYLLSYFMSQLIYDTDNIFSTIRGHSLASTLYGRIDPLGPKIVKTVPFSGSGRQPVKLGPVGSEIYRDKILSFIPYRHPNPAQEPLSPYTQSTGVKTLFEPDYGRNVPCTYPDMNNVLLGAMNANGEIVAMSGRRDIFTQLNLMHVNRNNPMERLYSMRPHPSYHSMFSGPGFVDSARSFPLMDDYGGDIKQVENVRGVINPLASPGAPDYYLKNDSIWMDLGHPVMRLANGTKYKPMFAMFMVEMDSKVDLMVTGNYWSKLQNYTQARHYSNQGFGPWEINPHKVIRRPMSGGELQEYGHDATASTVGALRFLFRGDLTVSRYGADFQSEPNYGPVNFGDRGRFWSRRDPSGMGLEDGTGKPQPSGSAQDPYPMYQTASAPATPLPAGGPVPFRGWDSAWDTKQTPAVAWSNLPHPAGFPHFRKASTLNLAPKENRVALVAGNIEALIRHGGTGTPAMTSDIFRLFKSSMDPNYAANTLTDASADTIRKARNLVTLLSRGITQPGFMPNYSTDDFSASYSIGAGAYYPQLTSVAYTGAAGGDFANDTTFNVQMLRHVNLNRPLTYYSNATKVQAAQEREAMANDVLDALLVACGMSRYKRNPPVVGTRLAATGPAGITVDWLAQLAVNIVDFIDDDEIMTKLEIPDSGGGGGNVQLYGVEVPHLVINEVYAQADTGNESGANPGNPAHDQENYWIRYWVELVNPIRAKPATGDAYPKSDKVILGNGPTAIYRLVMCTNDNTVYSNPSYRSTTTPTEKSKVINWTAPAEVAALSTYLVGPDDIDDEFFYPMTKGSFDGLTPASVHTKAKEMKFKVKFPGSAGAYTRPGSAEFNAERPLFALQRLANPEELPDAVTNPYVTIDIFKGDDVVVNDNIRRFGTTDVTMMVPNPNNFYSRQRTDTNQARTVQDVKATAGTTAETIYHHGFTKYNAGAWLTQIDRQAINPLELLFCSHARPHDLTYWFDNNQGHTAAWLDARSPLIRFLELTAVEDPLAANMYPAGQTTPAPSNLYPWGPRPGRINLNGVRDIEIWRALCDAQPGSNFTEANVDSINLLQSRDGNTLNFPTLDAKGNPTLASLPNPNGIPSPQSRPFYTLGTRIDDTSTPPPAGSTVESVSMSNTILRKDSAGTNLLFQNTGANKWDQLELLRKIYRNHSTTSNVFAVWLTVGFFEVVDEPVNNPLPSDDPNNPGNFNPIYNAQHVVQPPRLGQEIGRAENRHVRHRFFAVVDRSAMKALPSTWGTWENPQNPKNASTFDKNANYLEVPILNSTTPDYATLLPRGTVVELWDHAPSSAIAHYVFPAVGPPTLGDNLTTNPRELKHVGVIERIEVLDNKGNPYVRAPGGSLPAYRYIKVYFQNTLDISKSVAPGDVMPPNQNPNPVPPNLGSLPPGGVPWYPGNSVYLTMVVRGYSGPKQDSYSVRTDREVVPHFNVIQ